MLCRRSILPVLSGNKYDFLFTFRFHERYQKVTEGWKGTARSFAVQHFRAEHLEFSLPHHWLMLASVDR